MDLSTVRDIQWRVLKGEYTFSPIILEIRPGAHSRMGLFHALQIPEFTKDSWVVRPAMNDNLVLRIS